MDYFAQFTRSVKWRVWLLLLLLLIPGVVAWAIHQFTVLPSVAILAGYVTASIVIAVPLTNAITSLTLKPLANVRQAILHVGKTASSQPAPNIDSVHVGHELVSNLALQIYDLASKSGQGDQAVSSASTLLAGQILNLTPVPVVSVTAKGELHSINEAAALYLGIAKEQIPLLHGKDINDVLPLSFPSERTYEQWLHEQQASVVRSTTTWERVRLVDANGTPTHQFDMAASFIKGGAVESVITFFDRTHVYNSDDSQISFVAMAVHELRTPLTIMRGYIEVFEDELGPQLNPELKDFMHKMNASARQLTTFVSNILNVARVEENQLILTLHQQDINQILTTAAADLELRAQVHDLHINLQLAPQLPAVAADRTSIHEVINNLVDNAIKYGSKGKVITITSQLLPNNMVAVSVQDFGDGIPQALVPKLFDKFYRSHRSKGQVGGTGLGLYICKAMVNAHGGDISLQTKEGEGSTFTFTLEVYDETKHAVGQSQDGIMRGAHGWIKNHSLYRG